jgi:hypothetical protein
MPTAAVTWMLLIYTLPSEPSRLRATVWRELKKVGAVYLRDGVAVLPDRDETRAAFRAIEGKIAELGGQVTLVEGAVIDAEREATIISQANGGREEEYAELASEAERFLDHIAHEREHRELRFAELAELEADLGKLTRWLAQIRNRDHFGAAGADRADALLAQGDAALVTFLEESYASTGEDGG